MKKIYLLASLFMTAVGFVACDEDFTDWADPQAYEQEAAAGKVSGSGSVLTSSLNSENAPETIELFSAVSEGYGAKFTKLVLNGTTEVPFNSQDGVLTVSKADLEAAIVTNYNSLAATTRNLSLRVEAAAVAEGGEALPIALSQDVFEVAYTTPALPANASESAYYYVGGANGWNLAEPIPFESNGDGTYSLILTIGDGEYFCFAPQSAVDSQDWNALFRAPSNGSAETSGFLNNPQDTNNSFCCEKGGVYFFTLDMVNYKFSYKPFSPYYFVTGTPNSWTDKDKNAAFYPESTFVQSYTAYWAGAWDLKIWGKDDFGNWDACLGTAVDGDGAASGVLINQGANSFQSPEAGYYTLTVDFSAMTYTWTKLENQDPTEYEVITLSGDFNGWGDTEMTRVNTHNWYLPAQELSSSVKFKIKDSWDINWGPNENASNTYGTGYQGGGNISLADGVYDIYFNDITGQYVFIEVEE